MGKNNILKPTEPYFIANTIVNWIPVFTHAEAVQIILDSLAYMQTYRGLKIYAYVILDSHFHWIAQSENLAVDVEQFKLYTEKRMNKYLLKTGQDEILEQFPLYMGTDKPSFLHQIWEKGFYVQLMKNEKMFIQKRDYIHHNPVKRGYVDEPEHWQYSSAKNYAGEDGVIDVCCQW